MARFFIGPSCFAFYWHVPRKQTREHRGLRLTLVLQIGPGFVVSFVEISFIAAAVFGLQKMRAPRDAAANGCVGQLWDLLRSRNFLEIELLNLM
jgi:hypothetical protein